MDRDRTKKSKRRREPTPDSEEADPLDLKYLGVNEIKDDDYLFVRLGQSRVKADKTSLKSAEFKYWLKEEREKVCRSNDARG